MFRDLWKQEEGINANAINISLDINVVDDNNDIQSGFIADVQDFCTSNGYLFSRDNADTLKKSGLIQKGYYKSGVLFSFNVLQMSDTKIIVEAQKWRSNFATLGARYTLEKQDDSIWTITKIEKKWKG